MTAADKPAQDGYAPNLDDLRRDIYELLAFFLSSQRIAELDNSPLYGERDPVQQFEGLQRDLITKRLIAVAVTVRILDDQEPKLFDMFTDYCGTITRDMLRPFQNGGLGIRDACNKIIHARKVTFDAAKTSSGRAYLLPYLYLEGTEQSKPWTVNLDVVKFCRESAGALEFVR